MTSPRLLLFSHDSVSVGARGFVVIIVVVCSATGGFFGSFSGWYYTQLDNAYLCGERETEGVREKARE